ncbi:MAG TPA: SDR family NAD(P)-dependent oxidoreductase [Alphaproteobacteria bacterium]|jgi:NAD(P)-dependent dehydrogenase (short-subunit alcohol dehydrogenase family)|nr:SDR family NAD(P)-dependent oxidoreductase [Alphaproteobacteria bacterium]
MDELKGKVAIVTGASRGIGRMIAERLGSAGATVVLAARSVEASVNELAGTLHETAAAIEATGGKAILIACDVESALSRANLIAETISKAGRLDILVNNAGRALHESIDSFTTEKVVSQVEQYLISPYELTRLAVPHMRKQGAGWVVNLGSSTAITPNGPPYDDYTTHGGAALYAAVKAAIHRLTVSLAAELQGDNISVNVVAPVGAIVTPGVEALGVITEETKAYVEPGEHIAEATLALVTGDPKTVTGKIAFSYMYLDEIGRSTHTLDGKHVLQARSK